jgi:hypothetical protein
MSLRGGKLITIASEEIINPGKTIPRVFLSLFWQYQPGLL